MIPSDNFCHFDQDARELLSLSAITEPPIGDINDQSVDPDLPDGCERSCHRVRSL